MAERKHKKAMKGMSVKSGDKRSTKSGAGMTKKGVAKYNRRTGGNLKTAVTEKNPSKSRAARRKSYCARSAGQMKMQIKKKNLVLKVQIEFIVS